jgi:hypothetical protein
MSVHVVPGQVLYRWCQRCQAYTALEVGVYTLGSDGPPELVGTFQGCTGCDPDLFTPTDSPPPGGQTPATEEDVTMTNPTPQPDPQPNPEPRPDSPDTGDKAPY